MRVLMCPPTFYDVVYEINPWMDIHNRPDINLAKQQWESLYNKYLELGVEVELIDQVKGLPDMVFTANGGIVKDNIFISGNYHFSQRKGEEKYFQKWFLDHGYEVKLFSDYQGGEGDARFFKDTLYMGYGFRSTLKSHAEIKDILNVPIISLKLIDPYYYDFDTAFCPIGDRGILYNPLAFNKNDIKILEKVENSFPMTKIQAEHFIGNSVLVGNKLLVTFLDEDLKEKLKLLKVDPILLNMSEFKKAGGGIKCLTLILQP